MVEEVPFDFDVTQLKQRIHKEVTRRQMLASTALPAEEIDTILESHFIDSVLGGKSFEENKTNYKIKDFTQFYGEAFVTNVYLGILKRQPEEEGLKGYVRRLNSGEINKIDVLTAARFSAEGRAMKVKVPGLLWRYGLWRLRRIPVLGYLLGWVIDLLCLPIMLRHIDAVERETMSLFAQAEKCINKLMEEKLKDRIQLILLTQEHQRLQENNQLGNKDLCKDSKQKHSTLTEV